MRKLLPPGGLERECWGGILPSCKSGNFAKTSFLHPLKTLEKGVSLGIGDWFKDPYHPLFTNGWSLACEEAQCVLSFIDWEPSLFSAGKFPLHLWDGADWWRTPLPTKPENITKIEARRMFQPCSHSPLILLSLSYLPFFLLSFHFDLHFNSWMTFNILQHIKAKIRFQRFKWRHDLGNITSDGQQDQLRGFPGIIIHWRTHIHTVESFSL